MKKIIIASSILVALLIGVAVFFLSHRQDHFGVAFVGSPTVSVTDLATKPTEFLKKPVRIEGVVGRQCPAAGCWFYLKEPNQPDANGVAPKEIKVEMGDTVPKIPRHVGKLAVVEGQLIKYGEGYQFIGVAVTFSEKGAR